MPRRPVEEIEFAPTDPARVVAQMERLTQAQDGWINLVPGTPDDETQGPGKPSIFSTLFGGSVAPVTMVTWFPARPTSVGPGEATVGIMHPRGRGAVAQLRELGVPLPQGWRVRQDHNRRGLIVLAPASCPQPAVLDWSVQAGAALATVPLSGTWQARVFEPSPR